MKYRQKRLDPVAFAANSPTDVDLLAERLVAHQIKLDRAGARLALLGAARAIWEVYEHDESSWVSSLIDVAEGRLLAIYSGVDSPRVLVGTEPAIVQAAAEQHGLDDQWWMVLVPKREHARLKRGGAVAAARAHMSGRLQVPFGDQPRGGPNDLMDASPVAPGQLGGSRNTDLGCGLGSFTRRNSE